jgi:hypothetical protein
MRIALIILDTRLTDAKGKANAPALRPSDKAVECGKFWQSERASAWKSESTISFSPDSNPVSVRYEATLAFQ